jgi:hypothetical protein
VDSLGGCVDEDVARDFSVGKESLELHSYIVRKREVWRVATRMCLQYGSLREVETLSDKLMSLAWFAESG